MSNLKIIVFFVCLMTLPCLRLAAQDQKIIDRIDSIVQTIDADKSLRIKTNESTVAALAGGKQNEGTYTQTLAFRRESGMLVKATTEIRLDETQNDRYYFLNNELIYVAVTIKKKSGRTTTESRFYFNDRAIVHTVETYKTVDDPHAFLEIAEGLLLEAQIGQN